MHRYVIVIFVMVTLIAVLAGTVQLRAEEPAAAQKAKAKGYAIEESKDMAQLRQAAKHRKRRIIYNNDGIDMYGRRIRSVEDFVGRLTEAALEAQVDTMFYCTGVTTVYSHDTEIAERYDDLVDAIKDTSRQAMCFRNNMPLLRKAGLDSLKATIRRADEGGLEVFWSHRINDTHDSVLEWGHLLSIWKRNHPEYLMGVPEDMKKYPSSSTKYWWSALDFEKPEVRDYLYRITEEVGRRYDVDGIEIDYWRYPVFFRPNMDGQPATKEQLDILAEFQRSIRQMTVREGAKRGRPILLAARVPMSVDTCRNIGIDIERWLKEDLLDLLIVGNGDAWPNIPAEGIIKLGHKYDVPVYPCLKYSGYGINNIRTWRAAASNAWRAGADGVYFFNFSPVAVRNDAFNEVRFYPAHPYSPPTAPRGFIGDTGTGWDSSSSVSVRASSSHDDLLPIYSVNGSGIQKDGLTGYWDKKAPYNFSTRSMDVSLSNPRGGTVEGGHWIEFSFDKVYPIDEMWIWNTCEPTWHIQGFKTVTIQCSITGGTNEADWTTIFQGDIPEELNNPTATSPTIKIPLNGGRAKYVVLTTAHAPENNHSNPHFKELGDPVKLATLDKWFSATAPYNGVRYSGYTPMAEVSPSSMMLPATLPADGQPAVVTLQIGDDIVAAAKRKILDSTVLKIQLSDPKRLDTVEVKLNGRTLTLTGRNSEKGWLTFSPEPAWYKVGDNRVTLRLAGVTEDSRNLAQVLAAEVHVKYRATNATPTLRN